MPSFLELGVKGLDHFIPLAQISLVKQQKYTKVFSTRTLVQLHMSVRLLLSSIQNIQTELEHFEHLERLMRLS